MRALCLPAIALMNRLGYTGKFTLLWLTSLIAIALVVYNLFMSLNKDIQIARMELEGLAFLSPISGVRQTLQEHRGLMFALLGSKYDLQMQRAANEVALEAALTQLEIRLPAAFLAEAEWQDFKRDWARLREQGAGWSADDNFAAHTRLIERLQIYKLALSADFSLPMDPQIDSSALIDTTVNRLPMLLEHMGQIRAQGTRILAGKYLGETQKVLMSTMLAQLTEDIKLVRANIDRALSFNPALAPDLGRFLKDNAERAQKIVDLVHEDIMTGRFTVPPETFFNLTTTAIDQGYAQMHTLLIPAITGLVEHRIAQAERALYTSVGLAALLFMIVVYLSVGAYYAIIGSIQSLAQAAGSFAGGNMQARAQLNTRDELRHISDSFNHMADGFNAMLAAREEDAVRLRTTIETALDAVVRMDAAGHITGWNTQAERMFGWTQTEAMGAPLHFLLIPERYREGHIQGLQRYLAGGGPQPLIMRSELPALHRDGREIPVDMAVTSMCINDHIEFNAFIRDMTLKKEAEALIWRQANYDALTALPNRHMFHDRLGQEILKAQRSGQTMALLFIDLDRFKEINDTLGHDMGDLLLVEAAQRIAGCVRVTDTVARLGGDEFTVILPELADRRHVDRLTRHLIQALSEPFVLNEEQVYLSASVGVTLYPEDATEIEDLLKNADQAMYVAKNMGRNRHSYFTPALQAAAQGRLRMINDLRRALAEEQFQVYFQPIVAVETGAIHKAEALIRWHHPQLGMIEPSAFIPLAEETGLIVEIGNWVFREAMQWALRWRMTYNPHFQVSVNKSPRQFRSDAEGHCASWPEYLTLLGLPGEALVVEITEGQLLDRESGVAERLAEFRAAGIQVSIDDFGTGYSALAYLKDFNIDYLKIDRSFTRNLAPDSSDMALSEAIVVMAHKLGFKVIAEGVETEQQRDLLASATRCNYAQGYLFSKPVPPTDFEALLRDRMADAVT